MNKMLQSSRNLCSNRRAAFSIAELVVSIGVLVILFGLAGQVFNLTIQSTGQATALTDVSRFIRTFEDTIREDMRHVEPGRSVIVIQGNPVNAFWSKAHREAARSQQGGAGDPSQAYPHLADPTREDSTGNLVKPHADTLMVFSARPTGTFAHRSDSLRPNLDKTTANVQQVVYGHAVMGEYVSSGGTSYTFQPGLVAFPNDPLTGYPSTTIVSQVPASEWHLARRSALLVPTITPDPPTVDFFNVSAALDDPRLLLGQADVAGNFDYQQRVVQPAEAFFTWSGGNAWPGLDKWHLPAIFAKKVGNQLQRAIPFARSFLDPTPPVDLRDADDNSMQPMGQYFLPNCASFKVEWMLDPRSDLVAGRLDAVRDPLWFDPGRHPTNTGENWTNTNPASELIQRAEQAGAGTPLNDALLSLLDQPSVHPDRINAPNNALIGYSLGDRILGPTVQGERGTAVDPWETLSADGRPNLIAFGASRFDVLTGEIVEEDLFPAALKITIDLYDREGRFDRPIRHVMVIPVGG